MTPFTVCFNEPHLPIKYRQCLDALQTHYGNMEIIRQAPDWFKATDDIRYNSDVTRMDKLAQSGDWIYHDIDVVVEKDFAPDSQDKPWFVHSNGIPDITTIFKFDTNTELFQWLVAEEQLINKARKFGVFQALLYMKRDKISLIPQGHYAHLGLSQRS